MSLAASKHVLRNGASGQGAPYDVPLKRPSTKEPSKTGLLDRVSVRAFPAGCVG